MHGADPHKALPSHFDFSLMRKISPYLREDLYRDRSIAFIECGIPRHDIGIADLVYVMDSIPEDDMEMLIKALVKPSSLGQYNFQENQKYEWRPTDPINFRSDLVLSSDLQNGTFVTVVDTSITFLRRAVILGLCGVVRCLVDPNIGGVVPDEFEHTMCLHEASMRGRVGMIPILLAIEGTKKPDQEKLLRFAIAASQKGHIDIFDVWLKFGLMINTLHAADSNGKHVLVTAAVKCRQKLVEYLLDKGIIVNRHALSAMPILSAGSLICEGAQNLIKLIIQENNVDPNVGQNHTLGGGMYPLGPQIAAYLALHGFTIDTECLHVKAIQNRTRIASLYISCINRVRQCLGPNVSKKVKYLNLPELVNVQLLRPDLKNMSLADILNVDAN